jgi:hypothetical protein
VGVAEDQDRDEVSGRYILHEDMDDRVRGTQKLGLGLQFSGATEGLPVAVGVSSEYHTCGILGR